MLRMRHGFGDRDSAPPPSHARKYTISHAATIAAIALLALSGYLTLDRAIVAGQAAAAAIERTDRERMLSQRIVSLIAQDALGNTAVTHDLRNAIGEFERTHWSLVGGVPSEGIGPAVTDPQLKAMYFSGSSPLDAVATEFILQARRASSGSRQSASFAAQTSSIFIAAQRSLIDTLDAAIHVRQNRAAREARLLRSVGIVICASMFGLLLAANLAVFRPMTLRILRLLREAEDLARVATTDPLTGTLNKSSFQARGAIEIQKARRYQRPLSLLMIDADQLETIEAAHGPGGGETVLRALTSSFFAGTRISDLVGRVDAEQFAILLPETNCAGAELLAERLRRKISDLCVPIDDKLISCTVSIGVAAAEKDASFLWPTFKRADEALYEAKMQGRNRVVVAA